MRRTKLIKRLGKRIHSIRLNQNLTSQFVAGKIKIAKSTLRSLENGSYGSMPTYLTLKNLARTLGVRPKVLTGMVSKETGSRIKGLRMLRGESRDQLANNMNISYDRVSRWERGQNNIKNKWVNRLAKYFKVSPYYLTCQSDKQNTPNKYDYQDTKNYSMNLFKDIKPRVINPVQISLDDAVDKDMKVTYHGTLLKESDWNFCRKLIKRFTHP